MILPSPWVAAVLVLAAFRLTRLLGWDDLPPVARLRAWILGQKALTSGSSNTRMGLTNEAVEVVYQFDRPLLAHFVHCAFCVGWWVSAAVYVAWLEKPSWTLYGAFPLALSAAVGLVARNLDP